MTSRWEYKSVLLNVTGWLGPKIDTDGLDEILNTYGAEGWELVSAFDVNRYEGQTGALMLMLKRAR
jgi:hypothetical protein